MVVGQYFEFQFISGAGGDTSKAYQNAAGVASESISAIRTVAAFSCEEKVIYVCVFVCVCVCVQMYA